MFKLIDIVGFRTTSTTSAIIEKYFNTYTHKYEFIISCDYDFQDDKQFYINDNINDISRLFNILKNNGSLIANYRPNTTILIGKKLNDIKKDVPLYELREYDINPFDEPDLDVILLEPTNMDLKEILYNLLNHRDTSFLD